MNSMAVRQSCTLQSVPHDISSTNLAQTKKYIYKRKGPQAELRVETQKDTTPSSVGIKKECEAQTNIRGVIL